MKTETMSPTKGPIIKKEPSNRDPSLVYVPPAKNPEKKKVGNGDPTKKSPKKFDPKKKRFIKGKGKFDPTKKNRFSTKKPKKFVGDITKKFFRTETGEDPSKFKKSKLSPAYFDAVTILRKMSLKKGSINSLISTVKDQKNIKQVYALAINVIKNQQVIKQIAAKFPQPEGAEFDELFIEVLITDMIIGKKRFVNYRPSPETKFVLEHEEEIRDFYDQIKDESSSKTSIVELPVRYIRVNLLKTNKAALIKKLEGENFTQKRYNKAKTSFEEFMKLACEMEETEFMADYHFDDMLLFKNSASKQLTELPLYKECLYAVQDKSSMLALEGMSLKPGMRILDACAAPGMKSIAIASRLNNNCTLYANDLDKTRFKQIRYFLHKFGATAEKVTNADFSQLEGEEYSDLDVILLDPSCSGSGMVRRFDYGKRTEEDEKRTGERVAKLAKFQYALLESALKFNPKRIVYCTCSKLQLENEDVISRLLTSNPDLPYEVVEAMPSWPVRGTGDYDFSPLCLRSDMDTTLTCGFFCCVLQRKEGAELVVKKVIKKETEEEEVAAVKEEVKEEEESAEEVTTTTTTESTVFETANESETEQTVKSGKSTSRQPVVRKSSRIRKRKATTEGSEQSDSVEEVAAVAAEESVPMTPRKSRRLRK